MRSLRAAALAVTALLSLPAAAGAQSTSFSDPVGTISDVTANAAYYQPAAQFCVPDQVYEFPADSDLGTSSACPHQVDITVGATTPQLCPTCVRLFIDYAKAQPNALGESSSGHVYYRLISPNPSYYSAPTAHSPNIKNFTNDYLVAPPGSPQSTAAGAVDPHLLAYAGETAHYAHTGEQGPYYIGPAYLNQYGDWINGAYIDVDLAKATQLGSPALDSISYAAGYNANPQACPDTALGTAIGTSQYDDGNYLYGGCVNFGGYSAESVDPWPGS